MEILALLGFLIAMQTRESKIEEIRHNELVKIEQQKLELQKEQVQK